MDETGGQHQIQTSLSKLSFTRCPAYWHLWAKLAVRIKQASWNGAI